MTLGELIRTLETRDRDYVSPMGIGKPGSWRGDYREVAFRPEPGVSVQQMLDNAKRALNAEFVSWHGGTYIMTERSECHLAMPGEYPGDRIGPVLLGYMCGSFDLVEFPRSKS